MIFGRKAKPDIHAVGMMLTSIGINHRFDDDGDITFTMRLPGTATREADGSADWRALRYRIQEDLSIAGEFTGDLSEATDMAKCVVRIHLIGSDLSRGVLKFQAFPKVVPSKYEGAAHIDVKIPADSALDREQTGMIVTRFPDGSAGVAGAVQSRIDEQSLRSLVKAITYNTGQLIGRRFTGVMITAPA